MAARQQIKSLVGLKKSRDFFGIYDITSKDIAAAYGNRASLAPEERQKKYEALIVPRKQLENVIREQPRYFGAVRYDGDNPVRNHGQYEEDNTKVRYDTVEVKQKFVSDQDGAPKQEADSNEQIPISHSEETHPLANPPYKISEVQPIKELPEIFDLFKSSNDKVKSTLRYSSKPPLTFYFDGVPQDVQTDLTAPIESKSQQSSSKKEADSQPEVPEDSQHTAKLRRPQLEYDAQAGPEGLKVPLHELDPMSEEYLEREFEENKVDKFDRNIDEQVEAPTESVKPMRAIEYLKRVRSKEIKPSGGKLKEYLDKTERPYSLKSEITLDSKGSRIYTHQVPDWTRVRRVDALSYIRNSIVYQNYNILALNKPYGIASQSESVKRDVFDMNDLVGEVAKSMRIDKVYLAHRLDKSTTGILLFATSEKRAQQLAKLFRSGEIKKTYWCITRGIPDPDHGIVDMPIGEFKVAGKLRSIPVPDSLEDDKQLARRFREARRAVTEYQVIDQTSQMALVECKPQSGVKHQIRCHLGFGLNTPILGDHKYTYVNKLAPQRLPQKVLDCLHMRQSKVRTLPIHLHAKTVVIPGAKANGETLFISADLPQHFRDNLKSLRLRSMLK